MHLLFRKLSSVYHRILSLKDNPCDNLGLLHQFLFSSLKMERNFIFCYFPVDFSLPQPIIRFTLNSKGSLEIETFIIALKDASIPKAQVGLNPWAHLFLVLFAILSLNMSLKFFKKLCRNDKKAIFIINLLRLVGQRHNLAVLRFWPQI